MSDIKRIKVPEIRLLTEEEIERLQKDKRESYYKMLEIFERNSIKEKIMERFNKQNKEKE